VTEPLQSLTKPDWTLSAIHLLAKHPRCYEWTVYLLQVINAVSKWMNCWCWGGHYVRV